MHRFWYAYSDLDGADHYLPNIPQGREGGLCYLAPDLLQRDRIFCASDHGVSVIGSFLRLLLYGRQLGMGKITGGIGCLGDHLSHISILSSQPTGRKSHACD